MTSTPRTAPRFVVLSALTLLCAVGASVFVACNTSNDSAKNTPAETPLSIGAAPVQFYKDGTGNPQLDPSRFTPIGSAQTSLALGETVPPENLQLPAPTDEKATAAFTENARGLYSLKLEKQEATDPLSALAPTPAPTPAEPPPPASAMPPTRGASPPNAKPAAPRSDSFKEGIAPEAEAGRRERAAPGRAPAAPAGRGGGGGGEGAPAADADAGDAMARRAFVRLPEIAGAMPSQHEELWVISKFCPPDATRDNEGRIVRSPRQTEDYPGTGALVVTLPDQPRPVPVPLKHTDVKASIAGTIASVAVTQQYHNPFSSKIEAVYVFPLPENAAVSDFLMKVGDRTIRGVIRDRAEAEQIYANARAQGYVASLMTQERPNIFTQKVANIEPGKQIDVSVTYFNTLSYVDGAFEFVFPMVVAPRFNPPSTYEGIGATARNAAPGSSGQQTEVAYLRPTERSGHDIALRVELDAGVAIEGLTCNSHVVETSRDPASSSKATITLSSRDKVPNKDFVLRYKVAADKLKTGMVTWRDKEGNGYFSMLLVPPAQHTDCRRAPVEMIFVLDCSGSMRGRPIEQAVQATERALRRLQSDDTFQIINFAQGASQLGPAPIAATEGNIEKGIEYTRSLFAQGGTYMVTGLRASLDFPHDPRRLRYVCFLTDGLIGNDQEILGEVHCRLGASRIFSFGVGTSTNRYLLDAMAKVGRGCVAHLAAGDSPTQIVDSFFDRISRPALTDIKVDLNLGDLEFAEVFPRQIPDVYVGRPVVINGRFRERGLTGRQGVTVRGRSGGEQIELSCALADQRTHPALPAIWARHKIADLADYATFANAHQVPGQVRSVALNFGLLSSFTAFIAVDSMTQTAGNFGTSVAVPVPVPEGVRYETTVPER